MTFFENAVNLLIKMLPASLVVQICIKAAHVQIVQL